jgi:hypothetical protein
MFKLLSIGSFVLISSPLISAWTIPAYMNLAWPPRHIPSDTYTSKNGTFLFPNDHESCMNSPVPANATRTLFPIQGGRLQFDLVNRTGGPINEYLDVIMYIAYLDYTFCYTPSCPGCSCQDGYSRPPSWTNFRTGTDCSLRLNITDNLRDGDGNTFGATLVGLNVTFVLMFKDIRDHGLFEEVDEVCSIPLTSLLGLH